MVSRVVQTTGQKRPVQVVDASTGFVSDDVKNPYPNGGPLGNKKRPSEPPFRLESQGSYRLPPTAMDANTNDGRHTLFYQDRNLGSQPTTEPSANNNNFQSEAMLQPLHHPNQVKSKNPNQLNVYVPYPMMEKGMGLGRSGHQYQRYDYKPVITYYNQAVEQLEDLIEPGKQEQNSLKAPVLSVRSPKKKHKNPYIQFNTNVAGKRLSDYRSPREDKNWIPIHSQTSKYPKQIQDKINSSPLQGFNFSVLDQHRPDAAAVSNSPQCKMNQVKSNTDNVTQGQKNLNPMQYIPNLVFPSKTQSKKQRNAANLPTSCKDSPLRILRNSSPTKINICQKSMQQNSVEQSLLDVTNNENQSQMTKKLIAKTIGTNYNTLNSVSSQIEAESSNELKMQSQHTSEPTLHQHMVSQQSQKSLVNNTNQLQSLGNTEQIVEIFRNDQTGGMVAVLPSHKETNQLVMNLFKTKRKREAIHQKNMINPKQYMNANHKEAAIAVSTPIGEHVIISPQMSEAEGIQIINQNFKDHVEQINKEMSSEEDLNIQNSELEQPNSALIYTNNQNKKDLHQEIPSAIPEYNNDSRISFNADGGASDFNPSLAYLKPLANDRVQTVTYDCKSPIQDMKPLKLHESGIKRAEIFGKEDCAMDMYISIENFKAQNITSNFATPGQTDRLQGSIMKVYNSPQQVMSNKLALENLLSQRNQLRNPLNLDENNLGLGDNLSPRHNLPNLITSPLMQIQKPTQQTKFAKLVPFSRSQLKPHNNKNEKKSKSSTNANQIGGGGSLLNQSVDIGQNKLLSTAGRSRNLAKGGQTSATQEHPQTNQDHNIRVYQSNIQNRKQSRVQSPVDNFKQQSAIASQNEYKQIGKWMHELSVSNPQKDKTTSSKQQHAGRRLDQLEHRVVMLPLINKQNSTKRKNQVQFNDKTIELDQSNPITRV